MVHTVKALSRTVVQEQWRDQLVAGAERLSRNAIRALIALGVVLRLLGGWLYGSQDMEWWKAFGTYALKTSTTGIYGAPDDTIERLYSQGKQRDEITAATQTQIVYDAHGYGTQKYFMPQPPIYIYPIYGSTLLYSLLDPALTNNRTFNFFLNFPQMLASAGIALVIWKAVTQMQGAGAGRLAGLFYWLNPLVILNSPVQAYLDPLCVLFATAAVVMLYRQRLTWAYVLWVCAFMTKPQGVLIVPVLLVVGLYEHRFQRNLLAWVAAAATMLFVSLPFVLAQRGLSMVLGVLSIAQVQGDFTRQALNIWWPVQYLVNVEQLVRVQGVGLLPALLGRNGAVFNDQPMDAIAARVHIQPALVGTLLLLIFTGLNLWVLVRRLKADRTVMIWAAALQIYGYYMLRTGNLINHYFIMIPLFTLVALQTSRALRQYALICIFFFVQDLLFYGLGRDFNYGKSVITHLYMGWITVALALANIALFFWLCRDRFQMKGQNAPALRQRARVL